MLTNKCEVIIIKKIFAFLLVLTAVLTFSSCSQTSASQPQIITVNVEESTVQIDFTVANENLLTDYVGQDLTHADVLRILDETNYKKIPQDVVEALDEVKWDWDTPFDQHAGGVFEYEN